MWVYTKHYNCSEADHCRLLKQFKKIQGEVNHLSHIYYAVCEHIFSAKDHMDYHPSKHVNPTFQSSNSTNCQRSRRWTCASCKMRQYFDLSADETEYLSQIKVNLQRVNKKFHHNITKLIPGLPQKESRGHINLVLQNLIQDKNGSVF